MGSSMMHLVKFFLLGKKLYEQKRRCRYLHKINFFMSSVLSVEVLKLAITVIDGFFLFTRVSNLTKMIKQLHFKL